MRRLFILVFSMLLAGLLPASAEIRIGVVGPMSGQYSAFGGQMRRGVQMAVKEINASGGINGEKLKLVIGDDRCDTGKGVKAAEKMAAPKPVVEAPAVEAPAIEIDDTPAAPAAAKKPVATKKASGSAGRSTKKKKDLFNP